MKDEIVEPPGSHEPTEFRKTPKKAAASGWVGSALEYYDFFIYAQAASLIFPTIMFPKGNPKIAIVASLATFGVGYAARPIGAFFLGQWGDKHGRKNLLVLCMFLMGGSTFCVALLPTYGTIGIGAPILLTALRMVQGFAVAGELSGSSAMILEHAPFGKRGYFTSFTLQGTQGGQLIAAGVFLPLSAYMPKDSFQQWGWRIPFLLSVVVVVGGYIIRRGVDETPAFKEEAVNEEVVKAPVVVAIKESGGAMGRVICMALMNIVPTVVVTFGAAYATQKAYHINFTKTNYLWISIVGNAIALFLIPPIGGLSDRIGRKPLMIFGCLTSGMLAYAYLWSISQRNLALTFVIGMVMWGVLYQGYNAVFSAFYQEQFPTQTRVTAFALSQNLGTAVTAFMPTFFAIVAGPGSTHVVGIVGSITIGMTIVAALACWASPETYRVHLNDLGTKKPVSVSKEEYKRIREEVSV